MRAFTICILLFALGMVPAPRAQESANGLSKCLQAALQHKDGSIVKLEVETAEDSTEASKPSKGAALFEIEIRDADGSEWELTCDESSGEVIETEREVADPSHALFSGKRKVSEEQARKVALDAHPGKIVEVEYEIESDGAVTYEFDVKPDASREEWKVEVDATTGKIVETRRESYQIGEEHSSRPREASRR
jgi:uncharacterized membrane protein YkoI